MLLKDAIDLVFQRKGLTLSDGAWHGYQGSCWQFCMWLRNPPVESVRTMDTINFMQELAFYGQKPNGLVNKACAMKYLFDELRLHGVFHNVDPKDIPTPKKEFVRARVAKDEDIKKLLDTIPIESGHLRHYRNRVMILFLRDTGCRVGEMLDLKLSDIEGDTATIKTKKTRGMKPFRKLFWFKQCEKELATWLEKRKLLYDRTGMEDKGYVFVGCRGPHAGKQLTVPGAELTFRAICREAKIPIVNPHSFRHRKGNQLATGNANNTIISSVLGHSSLASSFRYTQLNDNQLEEAARKYGGEK